MPNADCIRVLSVDDHPLFREGIAAIFNCQSDMSLVGAASNGKEAIETFRFEAGVPATHRRARLEQAVVRGRRAKARATVRSSNAGNLRHGPVVR